MKESFSFRVDAQQELARTGTIHTARGNIRTPAFMPVGTLGTIKGMMPEFVAETGADIILCNNYHLMLRPGTEVVAALGGLHKFMNWSGPILTDSGGFQVMSLAKLRKIDEDGVTFRSHIDGRAVRLTPEISINMQRLLGADITMVFDECTAYPATEREAAISMELSMRWAKRSLEEFKKKPGQAIFGIVQGGIYANLRAASAGILTGVGFDGYAIGGLAVGEGQENMFDTIEITSQYLPSEKPRYLMGVGRPEDIIGAIQRGIDMFDCVLPTRSGRTGQIFTRNGTINIRNTRHQKDPRPLDQECSCYSCRNYGRGYVHHLFKSKEMLGGILSTLHNLTYYQDLMVGIRAAIPQQRLKEHLKEIKRKLYIGDIEPL